MKEKIKRYYFQYSEHDGEKHREIRLSVPELEARQRILPGGIAARAFDRQNDGKTLTTY